MDHRRFDALSRSLSAPRTRRGLLGSLAALGAGIAAARNAGAQPITQAYCGNQTCKNDPGKCRAGCVCCLYRNSKGQVTNSRCQPPGTCGPGEQVGGTPPGVCPPGANDCLAGQRSNCNGVEGCACYQTVSGATFCGGGEGECGACSSDSECEGVFGAGARCISAPGVCCGFQESRACVPPCVAPV